MGLDREEEMERKRGGDIESGSGDPVPSLLVCVWAGAAVKSIVACGRGGRGRSDDLNMHSRGRYLTVRRVRPRARMCAHTHTHTHTHTH